MFVSDCDFEVLCFVDPEKINDRIEQDRFNRLV
jgi:hypothetical protein